MLEKVMGSPCKSVNKLIHETIKSIPCRDWIDSIVSSVFRIIMILISDSYQITVSQMNLQQIKKQPLFTDVIVQTFTVNRGYFL